MAKRKHPSSITDPDFGALKDDAGLWVGKLRVDGFGKPWELRLELTDDADADRSDDQDRATPAQRATFRNWVRPPGFRARVQAWLLDYYAKVVEGNYRAQMGPKDAALTAPVLKRPEQIWELVSDDYFTIELARDPDESGYDLKIFTNCEWDEEHGLELEIRDGRPVWNW